MGTYREFMHEMEYFEYSQEHYEMYKEANEIELLTRLIENIRFKSTGGNYNPQLQPMMESGFLMESNADLQYLIEKSEEKQLNWWQRFVNWVKKQWGKLMAFFGKEPKARTVADDVIKSIKTDDIKGVILKSFAEFGFVVLNLEDNIDNIIYRKGSIKLGRVGDGGKNYTNYEDIANIISDCAKNTNNIFSLNEKLEKAMRMDKTRNYVEWPLDSNTRAKLVNKFQNVDDDLNKIITHIDKLTNMTDVQENTVNKLKEMQTTLSKTFSTMMFQANNITNALNKIDRSIDSLASSSKLYSINNGVLTKVNPVGLSKSTTITIPRCTSIGNDAFSDRADKITEVKFSNPELITSIGDSAFSGLTSLNKIDMTGCEKLSHIGKHAFANTSITELTIPGCVKTMSAEALANIPAVKKIHIGTKNAKGKNGSTGLQLDSIPERMVIGCPDLSEIHLISKKEWYQTNKASKKKLLNSVKSSLVNAGVKQGIKVYIDGTIVDMKIVED